MNRHRCSRIITRILLLAGLLFAAGCSSYAAPDGGIARQVDRLFPSIKQPTRTPFQPVGPTPTRTVTPTLTPEPVRELLIWLDPAAPPDLAAGVLLPAESRIVESEAAANLLIGPIRGGEMARTDWIYAAAAAFPTLEDEISLEDIQRAWRGEPGGSFTGPLLLSGETQAAFTARWGAPGGGRLEVRAAEALLDAAWNDRSARALIPFEAVEPRWKVLRVDGQSVFDKSLDPERYPLAVWFGVSGSPEALRLLGERMDPQSPLLPATNRDPNRMTTLVMTGVTALARATAYKMDANGPTYPARDIQNWLRDADFTHISNEVSFNPDCPPGSFTSTSTMFCSRPEYIQLLDFLGADIIELSGNHNNDFGRSAFSYSLDLYNERGWLYFAGGADLDEARQPLRVEHNGNRFAFTGCNPVGPPGVWATDSQPGAAACDDYGWMLETIESLRGEGYLPIATFQYFELYGYKPSDHQERHFQEAVDAGAAIVSGSQAHFPQSMTFYNGGFIHYGLGNLFFDQMDVPVPGTRKEFIDRHIFYGGRYIQTELLTALLEDYARPRPMTAEERAQFLSDIFTASGW